MTTDPRLTPTERDALARLLVGTRKGGEGWHRESVDALRVERMLGNGETLSAADESLLDYALRMQDRALPKPLIPQ